MPLALGLVVIAAAVYAVVQRIDVRLALLLAALALGVLGRNVPAIVQKFFSTLVAPEFLIPICSAMGFAYVLRHTGCDQHLVHLLVHPLRRARIFLIPGTVLVGFNVNIPIISQASATMAIGPVLVPLLLAARISPITAGAALLLGASLGGDLLNQGAPEFRSIVKETTALGVPLDGAQCVQAVLPLLLLHLLVATTVFWALSVRAEAATGASATGASAITGAAEPAVADLPDVDNPDFKVNLFKAAVPCVPLVLLFLVAKPLELVRVPVEWLVGAKEPAGLLQQASGFLKEPRLAAAVHDTFDSRLIGAAMLVGVVVAAFAERRALLGVAGAFFEGTGYAFANIISVIVAASCFGEGVKQIGLDTLIGQVMAHWPAVLLPAAGFLPLGFGAVCGSGMATTQSLCGFFIAPGVRLGLAPAHVGAVVALGASAGRTMSLVAAVTLMCATLTKTNPAQLVKRVAIPLLVGMVVVVIAAIVLAPLSGSAVPAVPAGH